MRILWRWTKRLALVLILLVVLLLAPIGYTEVACRGEVKEDGYRPLLDDPSWQRDESRTLTTYPEWHIVHAYDDYAQVVASGDPHEFGFLRAISGFWTSLCPLAKEAGRMGGFTSESKMTIYTIGVSFTAELLAKAAYEETLGRLFAALRGDQRAALDDLSAEQAAGYAEFLQQVPWYKWDFEADAAALRSSATEALRDRERAFALGLEYGVKAVYAEVIAGAVEGIGADELRLRSVVAGLSRGELAAIPGVEIVGEVEAGLVIETDRYRAFTHLLEQLAVAEADMVEIAGNDEVMFTALADQPSINGALYSFQRQGHGDWRHLVVVPVPDLLARLRDLSGARLEHVHDY